MNLIQQRLKLVREILKESMIDGILVTNLTNIRWLSGFTGSYCRLLISADQAVLGTDSRYWIQARAQAPDFELFQDNRRDGDRQALLSSTSARNVGFEANHITVDEFNKLTQVVGYTWVPLSNKIEELRQVKNAEEVTFITEAASITDETMALVPQFVWEGISEIELAWDLEKSMRDSGATGVAFPMIVAFGSNSALPHHNPSGRLLEQNDIILIDMGADLNGYKSDLTRTFFFGHKDEKFQEIFDLVLEAQIAAIQGIKNGVFSGDIHHLAMDVIKRAGYGDKFTHGLGHGLGLDIHEFPFLSFHQPPVPLPTGAILTIEPGIYLEGWGGVRIEDLVLVTDDGSQYLSQSPKLPFIHP